MTLTRPVPQPKRRRSVVMTREQFATFVTSAKHEVSILVRPPYDVVPCHCGDVNCHGWRFVERQDTA
jgi:hypothetical protein